MLLGTMSKLYITQGIKIIKAITIGSKMVQEKDISWSNRILGKEALTQMKTKIIMQDLVPNIKLDNMPSIKGVENNVIHSSNTVP